MRMHHEEWEGHVQEKEEGGGCEVCWSTVFISGFVVGSPLTGFMPQYYSSDIHTVYTHGSIWLTHLMYIWLPVCLCLSVCLSVCQSVCLSVCLCVYLSVCLSACFSTAGDAVRRACSFLLSKQQPDGGWGEDFAVSYTSLPSSTHTFPTSKYTACTCTVDTPSSFLAPPCCSHVRRDVTLSPTRLST